MKLRLATVLMLVAATTPALGAPKRNVLVLKSDGNADAKIRAKVDAAVLKLAHASDGQVTGGDISFVDAAAAAGCKPEVPTCSDEVLATFGTDEIVITTVTRKPGGLEVSVRRATKGQPGREVSAKVASETDIQIEGIGVLFGVAPAPVGAPVEPRPTDPVPAPTVADPISPKPTLTASPTVSPAPELRGAAEPPPEGSDERPRRGLYVAGMIGGGVFLLVGFGLWGSASGVQSEIDTAPKKTKADFTALGELEARGDRLANWGNVMFVGGVAIAGVSTYLFLRDRNRHQSSSHALITPTLFDHGGGIALTFGGLP